MRLWEDFQADTPRGVMVRLLVVLAIGLLFALGFTLITGENGFRRFAIGIFGVPAMITVFNLLFWFGESERRRDRKTRKTDGV